MIEEVSEKATKTQVYQFPLPRKDKDLWQKQQAILKSIRDNVIVLKTFQELTTQLDALRNSLVKSDVKYSNLNVVFESFDQSEKDYFLGQFIPQLCGQALKIKKQSLPNIIPNENKQYEVSLSREQVAQYVSCMFLCILKDSERKTFKDLRMLYTHHAGYDGLNIRRQEKIKCIYDYLTQTLSFSQKEANEVIVLERVNCGSLENYEDWKEELKAIKLKVLDVHSDKLIEDFSNTLQVDFANADIGGGILGDGLVQEEIRFSICPELLVTLLFFDSAMKSNEVILMKGIKQYCDFKGYSSTFRHIKMSNQASQQKKRNDQQTVLAIDALFFTKSDDQFSEKNVTRELNKAYIGFKQVEQLKAVSTGKWGCGAFNGVFDLKFVIQWIASSRSNKKVIMCTFEDDEAKKQIEQIYQLYKQTKASQLLDLVIKYPTSTYMEDYTLMEYLIELKQTKTKNDQTSKNIPIIKE